ncbi:C4-dicarboxylate ABC transporter permease [Desulfuribacillus stibiiarsenatis]|uniref:C4-dicarboxylate ABC transporter permease n=1 Tax=Desulfuribacillus stibiiarsenatis TaxID=1390249 RepID=A0A1E5LA03_9FIRM|nr:TRAP transporter large permease [Desulfuribacillus stibiiarsenatis]OEH86951.1 C4-dicarboxylate ABC transporter permease [Desulfuribacillus stibiiarsenatis]
MTPVEIAILSIIILFLFLSLRMPVAFIMLVIGMGGYTYLTNMNAAISLATQTLYSNFASYSLIVVPLFVWMGFIAYYSGLSSKIFDATYKIVGNLPGGLAIATVVACTAFGAICGSTTATAATMSAVALPEMNRYNYKRSFSTAAIASSAIIGVMIPPSVIFILYGVATGESISKLFLAGILPGILLMVAFMVTIYIKAVRDPEAAPAGPYVPFKEKIRALFSGGMEVVVIFVAVMGGLFGELFTPTEAGAVGVFATLAVSVARRSLSWDGFVKSLEETIRLSAMILFLVATAFIYSRFLAITGLPTSIASLAVEAPLPPVMVLILILFVYFLLGLFIDGLALVLMTTPIFYPVAVALGYDPIWFGVIVVLALGMGVITPPVGANVYVVAGVAKDVNVMEIFSGIWPFLFAIIVCIAILIVFPQIALLFPRLL